jgi:hypothetical protein
MDIGLMHVTPYSKADPAKVAKRAEELGFRVLLGRRPYHCSRRIEHSQ